MKGRDILKDLTKAQSSPTSQKKHQAPRASGSVRALKSELEQIANEAAEAKDLKEKIERDGQIVNLSPDLIDSAAIGDRIPDKNDQKFLELKNSIANSGQSVPVLVRPKVSDPNRYEAAYGHRRIQAAKELELSVRAIVRQLSDKEMILAQGQENGPRLDLSFIERALYAQRLLASNYDRDLVCNALSIDKPEVSRLIQVADSMDETLVFAIGPARKIGRPRWVELAKSLKDRELVNKVSEYIVSDEFQQIEDSSSRFEAVFGLKKTTNKKPKLKAKMTKSSLRGSNDTQYGWSQTTAKGLSISLDHKKFSEYLLQQLPKLIAQYENDGERES